MRRLAAVLLAVPLAACAPPPSDAPSPAPSAPSRIGQPLPAGASLEPAGSQPARTDADASTDLLRGAEGSLRPDDKKPKERVPSIVERGRLIVGVDQSNNLLSYRDAQSGELRGFEVSLAHELARDIFDDPNRVEFRYVTSAERAAALEDGTVDVVIRSMTISAQRQQQVEFSTPYLTTRTRLLVPASSAIRELSDVAGHTVCAAAGSTSIDIIRAQAPEADILATRTWGDCLMALQLGQADAIITDDALLSGMAAQDSSTIIVGEALSQEAYGVAVARDAAKTAGLVRQVNSTLERLRSDGTWSSLYQEWFGDYLPAQSLPAPVYRPEPAQEDRAQ